MRIVFAIFPHVRDNWAGNYLMHMHQHSLCQSLHCWNAVIKCWRYTHLRPVQPLNRWHIPRTMTDFYLLRNMADRLLCTCHITIYSQSKPLRCRHFDNQDTLAWSQKCLHWGVPLYCKSVLRYGQTSKWWMKSTWQCITLAILCSLLYFYM